MPRFTGNARKLAVGLVPALALAGCASSNMPRNQQAYDIIPVNYVDPAGDYLLGPDDVISLIVLNEPDLTLKDVQITSGGNISLPLIGQVKAAGLTTHGLASELAERLGAQMLIRPDVSVNLTTAASQKVTVEGSVGKPGVYRLEGRTTLLGALAMAEGTSRVSALSEVAVLRTVNGKQMGAVFDVGMIRRGELPDPEIRGSDNVVVGFSFLKGAWRDILATAPLLNVFRSYR
jgi:polysaccharide export outer membrane protein